LEISSHGLQRFACAHSLHLLTCSLSHGGTRPKSALEKDISTFIYISRWVSYVYLFLCGKYRSHGDVEKFSYHKVQTI
jgi:hypothetical protein